MEEHNERPLKACHRLGFEETHYRVLERMPL
jgi:hypothetical protein